MWLDTVYSSVLRYAKVTRAFVLLTAQDEDVARGAFGDLQQVHNYAVLLKVCYMHSRTLACKRKNILFYVTLIYQMA
jgi:hypothetical protein